MRGKSFELNAGGMRIEIIEFGARLQRCLMPDAHGTVVDVVTGFDFEEDYHKRGGTMGAIVGRYANRISNGSVEIGERVFHLNRNDGAHTMHGGADNFSNTLWRGEYIDRNTVRLTIESADGDQGWPGNVKAQVEYALDDDRRLTITMSAKADQDTYLNMLYHGYWNLGGHQCESVLSHQLKIAGDFYLPKSPVGVPTGEVLKVADTPFDFTRGKLIGAEFEQLGAGYGHNICLRNYRPGKMAPALVMADPESGRAFTLSTDQPGLQLYTANQWSEFVGKENAMYRRHSAVALETQLYPNSPNTPTFNPTPLRRGDTYTHRMKFDFRSCVPEELDAVFSALE